MGSSGERCRDPSGLRCVSISSLTRFLEAASDHLGPACVFIDLEVPDIDWSTLHQRMLEKDIEIPVVVVAEESKLMNALRRSNAAPTS